MFKYLPLLLTFFLKLTLDEAVRMAAWTHNTNVMVSGYTTMQLMTSESVTYPRISEGNVATETMFQDEGVRRIVKETLKLERS